MSVLVTYERFTVDNSTDSYWQIQLKDFQKLKDAYKFIERIKPNVIVRRIWIKVL